MKMYHECRIPTRDLHWTIAALTTKWTCPKCGEHWEVKYHRTGFNAVRLFPRLRIIRHWRWRREVTREMREDKLL